MVFACFAAVNIWQDVLSDVINIAFVVLRSKLVNTSSIRLFYCEISIVIITALLTLLEYILSTKKLL